MMMMTTCVIFSNTVTTTCLAMGVPDFKPRHGFLEQGDVASVVNRVLRMITSGPFGVHFATAAATVT
ncbi:hypothetical protein KIN20_001911 [Parelaphostrongylus tenuis]|uniref:Uncharacterized protein n=1 Tax=Parelaphostrongylus tenuis TaxID=148309 RepID=A0AAD5QD54_PARTN|nr:hypothetical protein KIN20_001911 [Parelaphostrongylus tenuis]